MNDHQHPAVPLPPVQTAAGPVDMAAFGGLLGAAMDGCPPCQSTMIDNLVGDHAVVAHAVAMAWLMESSATRHLAGTARPIGNLPAPVQPIVRAFESATSTDAWEDATRDPSLARAVESATSPDTSPWEHAAGNLPLDERRRALDYALDMMVGMVVTAGHLALEENTE